MHVIMCTNCTLGLANFWGEKMTNPTVKFGPKGERTQIFELHHCIFYHVTRAPKLAISRLFRLRLPSLELLGCITRAQKKQGSLNSTIFKLLLSLVE